jgi:hypothetical protein
MIERLLCKWTLVLNIALLGSACTAPSSSPGTDAETRTTATVITWSDGRPAISIDCEQPGSCQARAIAMCKGPNYNVLKSENMPTRGNATMVRGPASVIVRCNA